MLGGRQLEAKRKALVSSCVVFPQAVTFVESLPRICLFLLVLLTVLFACQGAGGAGTVTSPKLAALGFKFLVPFCRSCFFCSRILAIRKH